MTIKQFISLLKHLPKDSIIVVKDTNGNWCDIKFNSYKETEANKKLVVFDAWYDNAAVSQDIKTDDARYESEASTDK